MTKPDKVTKSQDKFIMNGLIEFISAAILVAAAPETMQSQEQTATKLHQLAVSLLDYNQSKKKFRNKIRELVKPQAKA